jgi:hypothetical protein
VSANDDGDGAGGTNAEACASARRIRDAFRRAAAEDEPMALAREERDITTRSLKTKGGQQ